MLMTDERRDEKTGTSAPKPLRVDAGFGLGGLLRGIGSLVDLVQKMETEGQREHSGTGEIRGAGDRVKGVYGFRIQLGAADAGPAGVSVTTFGNVADTGEGLVLRDDREPLVDQFDEGDELVVVMELPGVEEKDVAVDVHGDVLGVTAESADRRYAKEMVLPSAVEPTPERSLRNGVLRLRFRKARGGGGPSAVT